MPKWWAISCSTVLRTSSRISASSPPIASTFLWKIVILSGTAMPYRESRRVSGWPWYSPRRRPPRRPKRRASAGEGRSSTTIATLSSLLLKSSGSDSIASATSCSKRARSTLPPRRRAVPTSVSLLGGAPGHFPRHLDDSVPLAVVDRHDRETRDAHQRKPGERFPLLDLAERHRPRQPPVGGDVHGRAPARRVVRVGEGVADRPGDPDHGLVAAGVVIQDPIALAHRPQMLLRQRVLHARPARPAFLHEVVEAVVRRFLLEQPVHGRSPSGRVAEVGAQERRHVAPDEEVADAPGGRLVELDEVA